MDIAHLTLVSGACAAERYRYARRLSAALGVAYVAVDTPGAGVPEAIYAAALAASTGSRDMVLAVPVGVRTDEFIGAVHAPGSPLHLDAAVCVVDAADIADELRDERWVPFPSGEETLDLVAHAALVATQIEFASTIAVVNWEPLPSEGVNLLLDTLTALAPTASLRLVGEETPQREPVEHFGPLQERPGWIALLNGEDAHLGRRDARVGGLRYERAFGFHPGRLALALKAIGEGAHGDVVRSSGFCHLATRPGVTARWDHVGRMLTLQPLVVDADTAATGEVLALGQDVAFMGVNLDSEGLCAELDAALLSTEEWLAGPSAWAALEDSFPAWPEARSDAE